MIVHLALMSGIIASSITGPHEEASSVDAEPHIFVVAGQSNSRSYDTTGLDVPLELQGTDPQVFIWNTHTSAWEEYEAGVNSDTWNSGASTPQKWGPEAEFARQHRLAYPAKNVYIVKIGVDSTMLATEAGEDWNPANAELFADMTAELVLAKAALTDPLVKALLWMQGEHDGDSATPATNYGVNLTAFIAAVRTDWGDAATEILVGRISPSEEWSAGYAVRAFQMRVARDLVGVQVIDTDGYTRAVDDKHYVAASVQTMGADMLDAYGGTYPLIPIRFEQHSVRRDPLVVLTNGNATAEGGGAVSSDTQTAYATGALSGKCYWEVHVVARAASLSVGVGQTFSVGSFFGEGTFDNSVGYVSATGFVFFAGSSVATYATYTVGDRVNVAFDSATGKAWFGKNGVWNGDPAAGTGQVATLPATTATNYHRPGATLRMAGDKVTLVCDAAEFTDAPPAGFTAI